MIKEFSSTPKKPQQNSNSMWGGRFSLPPSEVMQKINDSVEVGKRLWQEDIASSRAHCEMLIQQGILDETEGLDILKGLDLIAQEIKEGYFNFKISFEDIHMNIEHRLKELIGETAGKLHTARSRNDQVATDFRLWVRQANDEVIHKLTSFQKVLKRLCLEHEQTIMPGFTHLQTAQPVTLAMHLDAYRHMLERDKSRFADCRKRLNESPLGACALSGTGFPIDRDLTAQKLGFDRPMLNTLDAVSARDFACEFLFACAQCGLHLSRLAEEIILWTTPQFGFLRLSDAWTTGSSIMPQKKNPDAAELVRAKTGRLNGNLLQLMTVMKALPLTYNKDMQEDKACVFDSFDTLYLCLEAMEGMIDTAEFCRDNMRKAAETGYAIATEVADWLVRNLNIPFRDAHWITGKIVKIAEQKQCQLNQLSLADMQTVEPGITADIYRVLSLENAIQSRKIPSRK